MRLASRCGSYIGGCREHVNGKIRFGLWRPATQQLIPTNRPLPCVGGGSRWRDNVIRSTIEAVCERSCQEQHTLVREGCQDFIAKAPCCQQEHAARGMLRATPEEHRPCGTTVYWLGGPISSWWARRAEEGIRSGTEEEALVRAFGSRRRAFVSSLSWKRGHRQMKMLGGLSMELFPRTGGKEHKTPSFRPR